MPSLHRHGTDRKGVGIFQQVICNAKRADVYPSALFADAMKPLNVLSKLENHFAIRTVCFQVQLEVDGYFSAQKFFAFATAASRASWKTPLEGAGKPCRERGTPNLKLR